MQDFIIFGGNGMLAHAFRNHNYFQSYTAPDIAECDITDLDAVRRYMDKRTPKFMINCAAYTDVTKAESDHDTAYRVNAVGAKNLAMISKELNCQLIHFSTDFVFKGDRDVIYSETDTADPVNKYGWSKLKGEEYINNTVDNALIIRVSWLYGPNGRNFVSIISKLMQEKNELNIVSDQFGKTTYTIDVVEATINLIENKAKGIYHFANDGASSRYEFTKEIYEILRKQKDFTCDIKPMKACDYPDPTPRPTWSVLGTDKYTELTKRKVRGWQEALFCFLVNSY